MEILYSGIYSEQRILNNIMENNMAIPFAQQKLEKMIIFGLINNNNCEQLTVLSTIPVSRYPKYKKIFINEKELKNGKLQIKYIKFINLPVIKQISELVSTFYNILTWKAINKEKVVIIYGTNPIKTIPFIMCRKLKKYKIVPIVTEIDKLRNFKENGILSKIKKNIFIMLSTLVQNSFDGYILICESMNELINHKKKPYCVVEGMICEEKKENDIVKYKDRENIIMYAGTLNRKYGIDYLVEAFESINNKTYSLVIYGDGDYKDELIKKTKLNCNIVYRRSCFKRGDIRARKKSKDSC